MKIERSLVAERIPVLRLSGELDLGSVPEVRRAIRALIDEGQVHFIINLTLLDFIDSSGWAYWSAVSRVFVKNREKLKLSVAIDGSSAYSR